MFRQYKYRSRNRCQYIGIILNIDGLGSNHFVNCAAVERIPHSGTTTLVPPYMATGSGGQISGALNSRVGDHGFKLQSSQTNGL